MAAQQTKYRVVVQGVTGVTHYRGAEYDLEREALDKIGAEIVEVPTTTEEEFVEGARDADAIIGRGRPITRRIIESLERCKVIALGSVGTDSVDLRAATDQGIVVTNVPDVFVEEVADHTIMHVLASARRLLTMDRLVREGRWSEGRPLFSTVPRLMGQTLGFVTFGHIPRAVARRARPFGFHMVAYDPYISELVMGDYGVEPESLPEVLQRSDFVLMHAPLDPETHHMLTEEHFRLMKPTAFFIANGRGPTVDEKALIKALEEGWIAGAGLDVFEHEPVDPENPLLHMPNVTVTPHVASASSRMMPETRRRVGQEIAAVLNGRWPKSPVNPAVMEKTGLRQWQPISLERGPAG